MGKKIEWKTIKIPKELADMCDELVETEDYTNRTDVIKYAVRLLYHKKPKVKK